MLYNGYNARRRGVQCDARLVPPLRRSSPRRRFPPLCARRSTARSGFAAFHRPGPIMRLIIQTIPLPGYRIRRILTTQSISSRAGSPCAAFAAHNFPFHRRDSFPFASPSSPASASPFQRLERSRDFPVSVRLMLVAACANEPNERYGNSPAVRLMYC